MLFNDFKARVLRSIATPLIVAFSAFFPTDVETNVHGHGIIFLVCYSSTRVVVRI